MALSICAGQQICVAQKDKIMAEDKKCYAKGCFVFSNNAFLSATTLPNSLAIIDTLPHCHCIITMYGHAQVQLLQEMTMVQPGPGSGHTSAAAFAKAMCMQIHGKSLMYRH